MLPTLLKKAVVLVVGKQAEEIAPLIYSNKPVNEFNIAKSLNITINQTRNILYKLSDQGLVYSMRKKDKKKGWYTYFWRIEIMKTLEFLKEDLLKRIGQIEETIHSRQSKQFFVCEKCAIEFTEEHALLKDFTCSECGGVFTLKDNSSVIRELNRQLDKLKKELEIIDIEIVKEQEKLNKVRKKEIKVFEKEKVIKRAEAAEKRKKTRATKLLAAGKSLPKKKVLKKKVVKKKSINKKKIIKKKVVKKSLKKISKKVKKKK